MKSVKKTFLFFCVLALFAGLVVGVNKLTDGFSVREIRSSLPYNPNYDVSFESQQQKQVLQQIVSQPFRYLGKGCQFYAFESLDGLYILKFPKHKHLRPLTLLKKLPIPQRWQEKSNEKVAKREERVRNLFSSCLLAYQEMAEETGLLYVHLNRTPALERNVVLIDKLGISHEIVLDDHEFVIQKKAMPAKVEFPSLLQKKDKQGIHLKIQQLMDLVAQRCQKGIQDRDRSFVQNVAFACNQDAAMFVDIGQFYKEGSLLTEEGAKNEIMRRLILLRAWAEEKCPELRPYVEEEIRQFN